MALKNKSVVCSDIEDPSQRAREHHGKYRLGGTVEYATIDATSIPYENHFDVIAFKSMLGGVGGGDRIDRQQQAIDQIYKALRPGGKLLFAENLAGSPLHRFIRKRFIHWGQWWRYVSIKEMRTLLRQFSRVELRATGVLATLGRSERQRRALAAIDRTVMTRVTPREWRYLVYGIAEK
jgi:SAM-dependent methyltransferase